MSQLTSVAAKHVVISPDRPAGRTSRESQGVATRGKLLQVVVDLLDSGGEQAVKVREIANALGVSVGAVYHHFDSREELIVAGRIAQFEGAVAGDVESIRDLVNRSATVDEFRTGMRALTRAAHSPSRARFRRLRAEAAGAGAHNPALGAALARVQEDCTGSLTEITAAAQHKGLVDPRKDPRVLASFIQMMAFSLILDDINTIQPMDRDAWASYMDVVFETFLPQA